jgi:hypothetical protein
MSLEHSLPEKKTTKNKTCCRRFFLNNQTDALINPILFSPLPSRVRMELLFHPDSAGSGHQKPA